MLGGTSNMVLDQALFSYCEGILRVSSSLCPSCAHLADRGVRVCADLLGLRRSFLTKASSLCCQLSCSVELSVTQRTHILTHTLLQAFCQMLRYLSLCKARDVGPCISEGLVLFQASLDLIHPTLDRSHALLNLFKPGPALLSLA